MKRPRRVFPAYLAPQGPPRCWVSDGIPCVLDLSQVRAAELAELARLAELDAATEKGLNPPRS